MINTMTNEPLRVETGGTPIHSLDLPYSQLEEVKHRLDAEGVEYWVRSELFIWEDEPPVAHISFHPRTDPKRIQEILDRDSSPA
jgi:hypothetical protein